VAVHGVCGAWGIIALGLLADGRYGDGWNGVPGGVRGLLYGDPGQLVASLIGVATNVIYVGTVTVVAMKIIGAVVGNRSKPEDEDVGLDLAEVGVAGYSNEAVHGVLPAGAGAAVASGRVQEGGIGAPLLSK
jgi:Amt family ammonium transporter